MIKRGVFKLFYKIFQLLELLPQNVKKTGKWNLNIYTQASFKADNF